MSLTDELRQHAADSHAAYPQYDNYFEAWTLGQVTKRIRTKGGTDLPTGTIVLADFAGQHAIPALDGDVQVVSIYDTDTTHVVAVEVGKVVPVTDEATYRHPFGLVTFI